MKIDIVERGTTMICSVEGFDVARVVGLGTMRPEIETRNHKGTWTTRASIDDHDARSLLREYGELAMWLIPRARARADWRIKRRNERRAEARR